MIAYICCTLPNRNTINLYASHRKYCEGDLHIFDDVDIPASYPTTTRYQMAYEKIKKQYDYYMFIGDDCEFTPNFEKNIIDGIEEVIKITKDRRACVYPDDGIHGVALCTHPLFTREWIDALGYFFPTGHMQHCFVDNYIMELGKGAKRIGYCESAKLIHHNYFKDTSHKMDQYQKKVYSKEFYEEDNRRYNYLVSTQLKSDIAKLVA